MGHYWNAVLVHHPLGLLWPLTIAAVIATAILGSLRRRGTPPRWFVRLNALLWAGGLLGVVMAVVGEMACAGLMSEEQECRSALKELGTGLLLYSQDWDDRMPPADRWFDVVRDKAGEGTYPHACPAYEGTYAFAMNRFAAGASLAGADAPAETLFLVEHPCRGPNETTAQIHPKAFRHWESANVVFLDGHARSCRRGQQHALRWKPADPGRQDPEPHDRGR